MTKEEIDAIKQLCEAASPGPWKADWGNMEVELASDRRAVAQFTSSEGLDYISDMEFIAMSREVIPKLIQELENNNANL